MLMDLTVLQVEEFMNIEQIKVVSHFHFKSLEKRATKKNMV